MNLSLLCKGETAELTGSAPFLCHCEERSDVAIRTLRAPHKTEKSPSLIDRLVSGNFEKLKITQRG